MDPEVPKSVPMPTWNWIDSTLRSWALAEMSIWTSSVSRQRSSSTEFEKNISALNASADCVFVFDISRGHVSVRPKPGIYSAENMIDERIAVVGRMLHYKHFILDVFSRHRIEFDWTFAVDMSDGGIADFDYPIFSFQKLIGSKNILLPDPEFFYHRYYEDPHYVDLVPYRDKLDKAIFVGSTTGGGIMNLPAVQNLEVPRLRSGVAFRDSADIDFRLPAIVQCETQDVEAAIRELGFGKGLANWQEQFQCKFLISMDGNGATCSRIAIGLKSNCVILKYASNCHLYYSHGLSPWLHYIPVSNDDDAIRAVNAMKDDPELYAFIADESQAFYNRYLNKTAILDYSGALFHLYAQAFGKSWISLS